jgi:cardiolipin synthase (CMP-forming)
MVRREYRTIIP